MRVRAAVLVGTVAALCLPAAAGAHLGDDGYRDDSPDLPNPLIERLRTIPQPAPPLPDDPAPPLPPMPGSFELVGHEPLYGRGMNSALAVHGHYVYVGNRSDGTHLHGGVLVVDVVKPSEPKVVGEIGPPDEALPGESSRELRVLPGKDLLLVLNHGCSEVIHRCASPSTAAGVSEARSTVKFYDIAGAHAAAPKLVATYVAARNQPQIPHEFFLWTDPREPSRVLMYWTAPSDAAKDGKPNLYVTDISRAREGVFTELGNWTTVIDNPDRDNRLHSLTVSYDGRRAYLAFLGGGFMVADTSDFADGRPEPRLRLVTPVDQRVFWTDPGAHSAIKVPGRDVVLTTDEVYGKFGGVLAAHGCPWGWVRFLDVADETAPRLESEYRLPVNDPGTCQAVSPVRDNFASFSSHNPTLTRNLAFITWHSEGLQAVDIGDPAHPTPAAAYLPRPLEQVQTEDPALSSGSDKVVMWSFPVIKDGLIYAIDLRNGLYILRYHGPHEDEVADTKFLDGNTNSGDDGRFEYAGRTAAPPLPVSLPSRSCLPGPLTRTGTAIGPVALGAAEASIALRAGPAQRTRGPLARWCTATGSKLVVAYDRAGRAELVLATGRVPVPRGARRLIGNVRVQRHRVYGGRFSAVATRALIAHPRRLRTLLARALVA